MSLITQCPACSTMFRVVPDQLRISEGWVRCGQCDEVFDANAHLRTLEESASPVPANPEPDIPPEPVRAEPDPTAPYDWGVVLPSSTAAAPEPTESPREDWDGVREDFDPMQPQEPFMQGPEPVDGSKDFGYQPEADPFLEHGANGSPAAALSEPAGEQENDAQESAWLKAMETAQLQEAPHEVRDGTSRDEQAPLSFMAQPAGLARAHRWPGNKSMAAMCLLLTLLLATQWAVHERNILAARAPAVRPLLLGVCEVLSCTIQAPQQIEAIAIESSAFTSLKPGAYRLSVSLKNMASLALAAPALELTLTDLQDQALVRRVLLVREYSAASQIAAGAELSVHVPISVQQGAQANKIAGYKLLAFYP